jgi:hypothetical protein
MRGTFFHLQIQGKPAEEPLPVSHSIYVPSFRVSRLQERRSNTHRTAVKRPDGIDARLTVYAEMINRPFGMIDRFYCSCATALRLCLSLWLTASGQE